MTNYDLPVLIENLRKRRQMAGNKLKDARLEYDYSRAKIKLGYGCNNDCLFCECRRFRKLSNPTRKQIARKILLAGQQGFKMVLFSGGEPTIDKNLPVFIVLAKKFDMTSGLVSNGRELARKDFTKLLVKKGLAFVELSLHADTADIHNDLTAASSFGDTIRALEILHELKIELLVNCVVTRRNIDRLIPLAEMLSRYSPLAFKVDFIEPKGLEPPAFEELVPTLKEAKSALQRLAVWVTNNPGLPEGFSIAFSGLPLCALGSHSDLCWELRKEGLSEVAESYEESFKRVDAVGRMKPELCEACSHFSLCPGVYEEYHAVRGEEGLIPETSPVSNSFGYAPQDILEGFDLERCPILSGELCIDEPERKIILAAEGGAEVYRTDTRDFTDEQVVTVKRELGQVYLDISGRLFHEDFESDLAKLAPHPTCAACRKFRNCPAVYERIEKSLFGVAEEELIGIIRGLSGVVLDVGGGPVRYADIFGRLVDNGSINYHVVEPDPADAMFAFLNKYDLNANHFKGRVEDYHSDPERFDWILVLRSHNHLFNLDLAYANIARWLKPDGRLIIVDNTAYGVVRSKEIWEKIESEGGPARFEHFNNHSSEEAIQYPLAAGLKLLEHHPVEPQAVNQWWCLFVKE